MSIQKIISIDRESAYLLAWLTVDITLEPVSTEASKTGTTHPKSLPVHPTDQKHTSIALNFEHAKSCSHRDPFPLVDF